MKGSVGLTRNEEGDCVISQAVVDDDVGVRDGT